MATLYVLLMATAAECKTCHNAEERFMLIRLALDFIAHVLPCKLKHSRQRRAAAAGREDRAAAERDIGFSPMCVRCIAGLPQNNSCALVRLFITYILYDAILTRVAAQHARRL